MRSKKVLRAISSDVSRRTPLCWRRCFERKETGSTGFSLITFTRPLLTCGRIVAVRNACSCNSHNNKNNNSGVNVCHIACTQEKSITFSALCSSFFLFLSESSSSGSVAAAAAAAVAAIASSASLADALAAAAL